MLTVDRLVADLGALGVRSGDHLMVHASLRAIGPVDGGAVGVIAALDEVVGPAGTILMTLGARDDFDHVNEAPEAQRAELLIDAPPFDAPPFDALATPAASDVGVLAEVLRTTPGTLVNDHPDGRFGARGALAADFTRPGPWHDYYGDDPALARFLAADGNVLRLGADRDTVTLIHHAEWLVPLAGKRRVRRHHKVLVDGVASVVHVDTLDDSDGLVDVPGEDYFATILDAFLATGSASAGLVGGASSELIAARDLVPFAVDWMLGDLPLPRIWPVRLASARTR